MVMYNLLIKVNIAKQALPVGIANNSQALDRINREQNVMSRYL